LQELERLQRQMAALESGLARLEKPRPEVQKAKRSAALTSAIKRAVVAQVRY
jgi:hypothetical protein